MHDNNKPLIIGLGHTKRVGKDTFARFLAESFYRQTGGSMCRSSFAYKLKEVCADLYGWAGLRSPEFYETPEGEVLREVVLPVLGKSPRQIWIDFGTKAVRQQVYDRTWVDYVMKNMQHVANVTTDVRFPNEAEAIHDAGGYLVRITRPGFEPGNDAADQALIDYFGWDYYVDATTIDELREQAEYILGLILAKHGVSINENRGNGAKHDGS